LSIVYTELLDFDGDEIYFSEQPALVGRSYFENQLAFERSTVIGVVSSAGVLLNPPADTVYGAGDRLILIAEDDDKIVVTEPGAIDHNAVTERPAKEALPERALVLGFNSGLHTMLRELDEYVAPGSEVTVVADVAEPSLAAYDNLGVTFARGDTSSRALLDSLQVNTYDHIIVLSYVTLDAQRADAKTLITLLHLRDMAEHLDVDLNVVSEMLDDRNRELAEVTQADDFIVSDKLISLMLSQISENDRLKDVFDTLFSSDGSEIYLKPVSDYLVPGASVSFYTVLEAARRRGETAIGYRVAADAHVSDRAYGVVVNPCKSEVRAFAPDDRIIVLAED
jgi:voltage-gated potassium channel Kch